MISRKNILFCSYFVAIIIWSFGLRHFNPSSKYAIGLSTAIQIYAFVWVVNSILRMVSKTVINYQRLFIPFFNVLMGIYAVVISVSILLYYQGYDRLFAVFPISGYLGAMLALKYSKNESGA